MAFTDGLSGAAVESPSSKEQSLGVWLEAGKLPLAWPTLKPWEVCHKLEYEISRRGTPDLKIDNAESRFSNNLSNHVDNTEPRNPNGAADRVNSKDADNSSVVPETVLVRNALYALQGVAPAVNNLENLSKAFCSQPADRSSHRTPSLWLRSSSTNALGKLLTCIARIGRIRCQLDEFVDYFLGTRSHIEGNDRILAENGGGGCESRRTRKRPKSRRNKDKFKSPDQETTPEVDLVSSPPFSLVNQAFAIAIKTILQGYLAALNTLTASVAFRRLRKNEGQSKIKSLPSSEAGCLTSVMCREITLLELYLHTGELRTHIEALGAICMLNNRQHLSELECAESTMANRLSYFKDFPRGADLLTYLYYQLREADPIHRELLKFLFARACQPYFCFIKSWLYRAVVKDPYKEFFVEASENMESISHAGKMYTTHFSVSSVKVRDGVSIPCFLRDACTPLLRAGQQLQVLIKLFENGEFGKQMPSFASCSMPAADCSQLSNLEAILDCWTYFSNENVSCAPVLVYSKRKLEEMIQQRDRANQEMLDKLDRLFADLNFMNRQKGHMAVPASSVLQDHHDTEDYPAILPKAEQSVGKANYDMDKRNDISVPTTLHTGGKETEEEYSSEVSDEDVLLQLGTLSEDADSSQLLSDEEQSTSQENGNPQMDNSRRGSSIVLPNLLKQTVPTEHIHEMPNELLGNERFRELDDRALQHSFIRKSKGHNQVIQDSRFDVKMGSWKSVDSEEECKDGELSSFPGITLSKYVGGYTKSESLISDYQKGTSWPWNSLPSNPFLDVLNCRSKSNDYLLTYFTSIDYPWDIMFRKALGRDPLCNSSTQISQSFQNNQMIRCSPLEFKISKPGTYNYDECLNFSEADSYCSLDSQSSCSLMGFHPMLTRTAWSHLRYLIPDRSLSDRQAALLPYYDFSAVADPSEIYGKNLLLKDFKLDHPFSAEHPGCMQNGESIKVEESKHSYEGTTLQDGHEQNSENIILREIQTSATHFSELNAKEIMCSIRTPRDLSYDSLCNIQSEDTLERASGGAKWETSLRYSDEYDSFNMAKCEQDLEGAPEIPLDVVVDKCIVQEVLLQYRCISNFAVRLLEEGFGLHKHLLALRRYFLMEVADWADGFVTSLSHHKWAPAGSHQRLLEVQAMLESSLQRSSYEGDEYEERLYIYIKADGGMLQTEKSQSCSSNSIGAASFVDSNCVDAFDFIGLGYKVDWPLNIVLTPDALKIYAAIFSFLMQIKLTVFSLSDIWGSLKELLHLLSRGREFTLDKEEMEQIRILMQFRQQVSHFVAALQQYIQSQLLHVVWCKFLDLLQYRVKDMLDLESVHKSYLCDSLHVCFLSSQLWPVQELISSMLQCIMDFRSCFSYKYESYEDEEPLKLRNKINYPRVLEVKRSFEQNLNQLYQRHIKFGEQNEISLNYFWMLLDYNEFVSSALSKSTPIDSK